MERDAQAFSLGLEKAVSEVAHAERLGLSCVQ
jgi:hypothetical protein